MLADFNFSSGLSKCMSPSGNHEWVVFSTALAEGWLMVECPHCCAHGSVDDPSIEEWSAAYHAPSEPYIWPDNTRVTMRGVHPREMLHVDKADDGSVVPSEHWMKLQRATMKESEQKWGNQQAELTDES